MRIRRLMPLLRKEKGIKVSPQVRVGSVRGGRFTMGWIFVVLFTLLVRTKTENPTCKIIGQTGFKEFSKDGDLIIGGVFSITSTRKLIDNGYHALPQTYCEK